MTPRIERFLADHRPPTPCLVVDLKRIGAAFEAVRRALPSATVYYAAKANPAPEVLHVLAALGAGFDAASTDEIERCLAAGARPDAISYGNTIKKESDIRHAYERGIRQFAFDSRGELDKLAAAAPGARVSCRIQTPGEGARWSLGGKFGCAAGMAHDLMLEARDRGLDADGISFHVGSQPTDPAQWVGAIARTADLFGELRQAGLSPTTINLGGGFPVAYRDPVPSFAAIADAISGALDDNFGSRRPRLIIEPGRCIAAEAGVLESEVVLVSAKDYGDEVRWVYLDVGRFSDLAETLGEAITYPIECDRRGGADDGPVILAGPTCDGADVLYEDAGYTLPLDLAAGDRLRLLKTGAYTATYSSVGFNGFAPLVEYYV